GTAVFLTFSRGGIAAFVVGQLVFWAMLWKGNDADALAKPGAPLPGETFVFARLGGFLAHPRARLVAAGGALVLVLAVAGALAYQPVAERFSEFTTLEQATKAGKLVGFRESLRMLADFPLTGIGRGAYPTAGARYLSFAQTAEYVEDEPLQLAIDLGIPAALALLVILGLALWRVLAASEAGPVERGLWIGLFSLGLHNLVDFSLELGGVALPAAGALALLLRSTADPAESVWKIPARASVALLAFALPLAFWGIAASSPDWRAETDAFARAAPYLGGDQAAAAAAPVLSRHPASYVVPLAVADRYLRDRMPGAALSWANRAMYFRRDPSTAHLIAATALAEMGRKTQALLEARTYYRASAGRLEAIQSLARFYPEIDDLRLAVDDSGRGLLSLADYFASRKREGDAARSAELASVASPEDAQVHVRAAGILTASGQVDEAEHEAQRAVELAPDQPGGYLALA